MKFRNFLLISVSVNGTSFIQHGCSYFFDKMKPLPTDGNHRRIISKLPRSCLIHFSPNLSSCFLCRSQFSASLPWPDIFVANCCFLCFGRPHHVSSEAPSQTSSKQLRLQSTKFNYLFDLFHLRDHDCGNFSSR